MSLNLSPSALGVFKNCPRCFWLEKNRKIKQPRGVFPSLPGGMDKRLKELYDASRATGKLPEHLIGKLEGKLYENQGRLDRWRNWRTGLSAVIQYEEVNTIITGAVDDILVDPQGLYEPLDYKTRSGPPKEGQSELYYGTQLDCYDLLFQRNDMPISGKGHLVYGWPIEAQDNGAVIDVQFQIGIVTLDVVPERAADLAVAAVRCISQAEPPPAHPNCEYCSYVTDRTSKGF